MAVTDMYMQYGAAQQAQNKNFVDTLMELSNRKRQEELYKQKLLEEQKKAAIEQSQDPAYILAQLRQGGQVSPQQQAILDIASAKSERAVFDPNTGQLVQTGGFPAYGQQAPQAAPQGVQPSRAPAGLELDEEARTLLESTTNPRERAAVRENLMKEAFTKRKEQRELSKQQKKDLMQSKELKRTLDTLLNDPNLSDISGSVQGGYASSDFVPAWLKTDAQRKLQPVVNKLKGQQFLQAYQGLRGGGQITEVEGKKAEQAQAALDQSMEDKDFRKALLDYSKVIENGIARLEGREPPHTFEEEASIEVPQGYVKIGTSGGKDVYRSPDGRTFVME